MLPIGVVKELDYPQIVKEQEKKRIQFNKMSRNWHLCRIGLHGCYCTPNDLWSQVLWDI